MGRRDGQPFLGFPSRTEAVRAFLAEGVSRRLATAMLEPALPNIKVLLEGAALWGTRTPSIDDAQLGKARRAVQYLGEALGVHPALLVARLAVDPLALLDTGQGEPGVAAVDDVADEPAPEQPDDDLARWNALGKAAEPHPQAAVDADLEREELIELGAAEAPLPTPTPEPDSPPAALPPPPAAPADPEAEMLARVPASTRFLLRARSGEALHESCLGLTTTRRFFWRGTAAQLRAVRRRYPQWLELKPEVTR